MVILARGKKADIPDKDRYFREINNGGI